MPTGPLGGPRPFADSELIYQARYNVTRGIGETLESDVVREPAERLIAQRIEDVGFRDPSVKLSPGGSTLLVQIGLGNQNILASGSREKGLNALQEATDEGVLESVDDTADRGTAIDAPEWEITCK